MDKDNAAPSMKFLSGFDTSVGGTFAYRRYARGAQKCYKPVTTRWPFLTGILILTLALIAIVEVVLRRYPIDNALGDLAAPNITRRFVPGSSGDERIGMDDAQDWNIKARVPSTSAAESSASSSPADSSTIGINVSTQTGPSTPTTTTPTIGETYSTIPEAYIPTSTPSYSPNTNPSAYIATSTTIPKVATLADQTISSAYVPSTSVVNTPVVATPLALQSSTPKSIHEDTQYSAYIPTVQSPPKTAPGGYLPTFTTTPGAYIPTTQPLSVLTTITLPNSPPVNIPTFTTTLGAYIPTTQPVSVLTTTTLPNSVPTNIPTFTTTPGAYIPTHPPPLGTSSAAGPSNEGEYFSTAPGAFIPIGSTSAEVVSQLGNAPTSTIDDPNAMVTSLIPVSTLTSGGSAVLVLGSPSTSRTPLVPISTYTSNGVALVVMGSLSRTSMVPVSTYTSNGVALVVMGSPSRTSMVPVSTYTSNGFAVVVMGLPLMTLLVPVSTMTSNGVAVVVLGLSTPQPIISAVSISSYSVIVEQATSTSGSVAYVYMTTITLGPWQSASETATAAAPKNTAVTTSDQQKTTTTFTSLSYFAGWYLPTIIAVAFRVLWTIVYNNARLMEPFYRLASPAGVTGKHALDTLYLSMGSIVPEPVLALLSGHSYMLLVSTIAYLIELVAPLSSEFLGVDVRHGCVPDPSMTQSQQPCPARIVVRLVPARVLQVLLCLIAVFIIFTMFLSRHRPSGVYSDPSSIAVMASLLHHRDILQDFKHLNAGDKESERAVNDQTYRLTHYQAEGEGMKYGVVPTIKIIEQDTDNRGAYGILANPEGGVDVRSRQQSFKRHLFRTVGDVLLAFLLLGILGVTLGYYLDGGNDTFNIFFNSGTFGPRFILAFAGGIAVSQWKRLEKEVRTLQPYRNLSSSGLTSPLNTILRTTTSTPYSTLPLAIARFEPFTALIAFCYILSEILVIMVVTVPYSPAEFWMAFLAGTYLTISILSLQILTFIALITWWRRTTPDLDRDPDTLIGVWTLLAASGTREDFDDMGTAGRRDLVRTVTAWDKPYWLGKIVAKDGVMRMGIHSDAAREDTGFESLRGERSRSPLPFSLPPVPDTTVSSEI